VADEALVPRILAGETALFGLIMRRHNQRLYRAARAILKRRRRGRGRDAGDLRARLRPSRAISGRRPAVDLAHEDRRARGVRPCAPAAPPGGASPDDNDVETLLMADRPKPADPEREANNAELRGLLEARSMSCPRRTARVRAPGGVGPVDRNDCRVPRCQRGVVKTRLSRAERRLREGSTSAPAPRGSAFTFGASAATGSWPRCSPLEGQRPPESPPGGRRDPGGMCALQAVAGLGARRRGAPVDFSSESAGRELRRARRP
jgi:RNA polymerase sigma-70 factor (ECF subfamily)